MARAKPLLYLREDVLEKAEKRATGDHLTVARALEVLLDGYAEGRVTITPVDSRRDGKTRVQRRMAVAQDVLDRALDTDGKPTRGDAPSFSRLAEVLLSAYVDGRITLTVTAAGHAGPAGRDQEAV